MPRPKPEPKKPAEWRKAPDSKWWAKVEHTLGSNIHSIVMHADPKLSSFSVAEARAISAWFAAAADYTEFSLRKKIR